METAIKTKQIIKVT